MYVYDYKVDKTGGESGIRTHVTLSSKHAFQACAFSHSAISPAKTSEDDSSCSYRIGPSRLRSRQPGSISLYGPTRMSANRRHVGSRQTATRKKQARTSFRRACEAGYG